MKNNDNSSGVVSTVVVGLIGVLFLGLKLTGVIEWSWIWVLSPFWIPTAFVIVVIIVGSVVAGILAAINGDR